MSEQISITLSASDAEVLSAKLAAKNVGFQTLLASRNIGVDVVATILVPTTLTAVQVVATFLAARRAEKSTKENEDIIRSAPNIRIGHMTIGEHRFTVELIENKLGRPLNDN